jgi:hypothetical protein
MVAGGGGRAIGSSESGAWALGHRRRRGGPGQVTGALAHRIGEAGSSTVVKGQGHSSCHPLEPRGATAVVWCSGGAASMARGGRKRI